MLSCVCRIPATRAQKRNLFGKVFVGLQIFVSVAKAKKFDSVERSGVATRIKTHVVWFTCERLLEVIVVDKFIELLSL